MAQIHRGDTFTDGETVTGLRLNNLVDASSLLTGSITEQVTQTAGTVAGNDYTLIYDASADALVKTDVTSLLGSGVPVMANYVISNAVNTPFINSYALSDLVLTAFNGETKNEKSFISYDGALVTVTDNNHNLLTGMTLQFSNATNLPSGSYLPAPLYNGIYPIIVINANTFSYSLTTETNGIEGLISYKKLASVVTGGNHGVNGNINLFKDLNIQTIGKGIRFADGTFMSTASGIYSGGGGGGAGNYGAEGTWDNTMSLDYKFTGGYWGEPREMNNGQSPWWEYQTGTGTFGGYYDGVFNSGEKVIINGERIRLLSEVPIYSNTGYYSNWYNDRYNEVYMQRFGTGDSVQDAVSNYMVVGEDYRGINVTTHENAVNSGIINIAPNPTISTESFIRNNQINIDNRISIDTLRGVKKEILGAYELDSNVARLETKQIAFKYKGYEDRDYRGLVWYDSGHPSEQHTTYLPNGDLIRGYPSISPFPSVGSDSTVYDTSFPNVDVYGGRGKASYGIDGLFVLRTKYTGIGLDINSESTGSDFGENAIDNVRPSINDEFVQLSLGGLVLNGQLFVDKTKISFKDGIELTQGQIRFIDGTTLTTAPNFANFAPLASPTFSGAVKITNTTLNESFRVEDETSPDSTPFVISNTGRVGIGIAPDNTVALKLDSSGMSFNGTIFNVTSLQNSTLTQSGNMLRTDYPKELRITVNGQTFAIPARAI